MAFISELWKIKMNLKLWLEIIAISLISAIILIWLIVFYTAYFNGNISCIYINKYHEAKFEFIMGILTFESLIYLIADFVI